MFFSPPSLIKTKNEREGRERKRFAAIRAWQPRLHLVACTRPQNCRRGIPKRATSRTGIPGRNDTRNNWNFCGHPPPPLPPSIPPSSIPNLPRFLPSPSCTAFLAIPSNPLSRVWTRHLERCGERGPNVEQIQSRLIKFSPLLEPRLLIHWFTETKRLGTRGHKVDRYIATIFLPSRRSFDFEASCRDSEILPYAELFSSGKERWRGLR